MAYFDVVEKFVSINGEGRKAGQLAVFIRFKGCNLKCEYCDTKWANENDAMCEKMTEHEIYQYIKDTGVKNVTLTGGEPLYRDDIDILLRLLDNDENISVEIETNGSIDLTEYIKISERITFTVDYKLSLSGMEKAMYLKNYEILRDIDTVKFVVGNVDDLIKSKAIIDEYNLAGKCKIYLSPVFGKIKPEEIVEFMKDNRMNDVNCQLQLHKYIWDPNKKGV